ncbi:MAG: outer membrane protein assembly factor [Rhodospirillaceae bacterium]|nr:outer membrane protein assembly factor [Rhodospirillaceae bacterium]
MSGIWGGRTAARLSALMLLVLALATAAAGRAAAAEVAYEVEIRGVEDATQRVALDGVSRLVRQKERPPPSLPALRRRAEADLAPLEEAMASFGYYDAVARYAIDAAASPVKVVVTIEPGALYRLSEYNIIGPDPALSDGSIRVTARRLGVARNDPAAAAAVRQSEQRLLNLLARQARPLAQVVDRRIVVDHDKHTMAVTLKLDIGPRALFGPLRIEGLETVDEHYVRLLLPWREGEPFDSRKVEQGRQAVVSTGLFTTVRIAHADAVGPDGRLPMTLTVTEGKHRSVGAGLSYDTTTGFSAQAFWEHRNLLGAGERLRLTATGGETEYGLKGSLLVPAFFDDMRNTLLVDAEGKQEDLEAYDSTRIGVTASVERAFTSDLSGSAGLTLEAETIRDQVKGDQDYTLVGLPLGLSWDTSNDLFDPRRGNRLKLSATPYTAVAGTPANFVVTRLFDSFYLSLGRRVVLANWARAGFVFGESLEDVPADKRLYGGGGGSVRAFGYQRLGPLDEHGDPTGGRSLLEFGSELRVRISDQFGAVAFVEGGNVYPDVTPDPGDSFLWGGGVGVRYFTSFGPIRLDVATPINPRSDDDPVQVYVSIGQAF